MKLYRALLGLLLSLCCIRISITFILPIKSNIHHTASTGLGLFRPISINDDSETKIIKEDDDLIVEAPDYYQKGGITTTAPAVLLHSGPGTGKSRVLSARLAYIFQSNWMTPEDVIVLSFTNRDAKVIRDKALAMMRR